MRLIKNTGSDRVVDELRACLAAGSRLDFASPGFSLYAYAELKDLLDKLGNNLAAILEQHGIKTLRSL